MNKKILLSFLLVFLVAVSLSAVSAADDADDIVAAGDDNVVLKETITVEHTSTDHSTDAVDIENAVKNAKAGDTIDLGSDYTYDTNYTCYTIGVENITVTGNNVTINTAGGNEKNSGATFQISKAGSGAVIKGITFNDVFANINYTGADTLKGWAINPQGTSNVLIQNCTFYNFNQAVSIRGGCNNITVDDCYFTGYSTHVTNTGAKEYGSKVVSVMGSHNVNVLNSYFVGPMLDGVSCASNSKNITVDGNTFIGNAYAIYFGGAATDGAKITNNVFSNCGYLDTINVNTNQSVVFEDLPVISVQKSNYDYLISNNTFFARNSNILIKGESGNTAHGYPTEIGAITITNNNVTAIDDSVVPQSVTLYYLYANSGLINPIAAVDLTGNKVDKGIKVFEFWSADWGTQDGDVYIDEAPDVATFITPNTVQANGIIIATLYDANGDPIKNAVINYNYANVTGNTTTDSYGMFTVAANLSNVEVVMTYDGNEAKKIAGFSTSVYLANLTAAHTDLVVNEVLGDGTVKGHLLDSYGMVIANAPIMVALDDGSNKTIYTDDEGNFEVNGSMTGYSFIYEGDATHEEASAAIILNDIAPARAATQIHGEDFTQPAIDYYAGERGGYFKVNLTDADGKALANKEVLIGYNGKCLNLTTDENGQVELRINLLAANTLTFAVAFLGDEDYNASFAVYKITITKKTAKLTAPAKTYKASAKTKSYTVTLTTNKNIQDGKTYLGSNKPITLTLNGKTYTAKTNAKGQATFKLSITKKGTYTATINYAGDNTYNSAKTTAKIKIN